MRPKRRLTLILFASFGLFLTIAADVSAVVGSPVTPASVAGVLAVVGRPATPGSVAGVARRSVRRTAY